MKCTRLIKWYTLQNYHSQMLKNATKDIPQGIPA